jgi:hypothetical protein
MWSSLATTFNYIAPAHIDEDSFLSALVVSYVPKNLKHLRHYKYKHDMEIAVYFCYPTLGICIGLRPGDILFFNPLHYHCVSQRTEAYKNETVYLTSFYLKNKEMSGNNNSIPVTEEVLFHCDVLDDCMNACNDI